MPTQGEKTDMIFPKPPASSGTRSTGLCQLLPRQAGQAAEAAPQETGRTIRNTRSSAGMREIPWRGALVSLGRICSRLGCRPEVATSTALSPVQGDLGGASRGPVLLWPLTPDGSRTPPHGPPKPLTGAKLLLSRLVINHICGSCFERQIHTDAVLQGFFTAELVARLELRHLCTCSNTLLLQEEKPTLPLQGKHT